MGRNGNEIYSDMEASKKSITGIDKLRNSTLSVAEYTNLYNSIIIRLKLTREKLSELFTEASSSESTLSNDEIGKIKELLNAFKAIETDFNKNIRTPSAYAEEYEKNKPGKIDFSPKSALRDIEITPEEIKNARIISHIATNTKSPAVEYYTAEIGKNLLGNPRIGVIRIDRNDSGEELAFLETGEVDKDLLIGQIEAAEMGGSTNFKDIEIDGHNAWNTRGDTIPSMDSVSASVNGAIAGGAAYLGVKSALGMVGAKAAVAGAATGAGTTGAATGAATGAGAAILKWGRVVISPLAWVGRGIAVGAGAIAGAAVSAPVLVAGGVTVATGLTVGALTDVDLTTERAQQFGIINKMDAVKQKI